LRHSRTRIPPLWWTHVYVSLTGKNGQLPLPVSGIIVAELDMSLYDIEVVEDVEEVERSRSRIIPHEDNTNAIVTMSKYFISTPSGGMSGYVRLILKLST